MQVIRILYVPVQFLRTQKVGGGRYLFFSMPLRQEVPVPVVFFNTLPEP